MKKKQGMKKNADYIMLQKCISKEVMIRYIHYELDETSFLDVCHHIESCEYCSEALKGLKQLPDLSSLNVLPLLWHKRTGFNTPSQQTGYFSKLIIGALSAVLIVSIFVFIQKDNKKISKISEKTENNKVISPPVNIEKLTETEVGNNEMLPPMNVARGDKLEPDRIPENEIQNKVPLIEAYILNKSSADRDILPGTKSFSEKIIYFEDLKTVDYSKKYSMESWDIKMQGHVDAQYENKQQRNKKLAASLKDFYAVSYEKVLSGGLRNLKRGYYLDAISDFDFLLNYFPADLNCKFYRTLCLENLGSYAEAKKQFSEIISSPVNVFYEESKWHLALSEIGLKNYTEAKNILRETVAENGFYKSKAEEMLEELK